MHFFIVLSFPGEHVKSGSQHPLVEAVNPRASRFDSHHLLVATSSEWTPWEGWGGVKRMPSCSGC